MLNLSKISRVILISGILMAFSGAFLQIPAYAADDSAASEQKSRAQKKADKAAAEAKETQDAYDKIVGGGSVTTYTTNGRTTGVKTSGSEASQWETALIDKNKAQEDYTKASTAYNRCVAEKGAAACSAEKQALDEKLDSLNSATKDYNKAQEEATDAYYENKVAQEKAEKAAKKAEEKQLKADQKELKNAEKDLEKAQKKLKKCQEDGGDCSAEQAAVTAAQDSVSSAQQKVDSHNTASDTTADNTELGKLQQKFTQAGDDHGKQVDAAKQLQTYMKDKEEAADAADAECERYSAMTSSDARDKAKEACANAITLRKEADAARVAYEAAMEKVGSLGGVDSAQRGLKEAEAQTGSYGVIDISKSRQIGDSGPYSLAGYKSQYFEYNAGGDVFDKVTRRAALAVVTLKPIVYIFAGFGLIAFAWMAIFNKLSWKWFANIAMGLFLVANMGRLIEYFVTDEGGAYYIGIWDDNTRKSSKRADIRLANAFADVYYVYGDTTDREIGIRMFSEAAKAAGGKTTEEFKPSAAGFCQSTSGSGWANFTSCVKDIVSTAKKVANTVQTVASTAQDIYARYETVKDSVSNIKQAVESMKGSGLSGIISGTGNILNNVNSAVSTTTGAVGSLTNTASSVSNNIQDMGKSVAQQQELQDRRNLGEATNAFDAMLKGQEWNETTHGVENVDGDWASKGNIITQVQSVAKDVGSKAGELNSSVQSGLTQAGKVVDTVENFSIGGSKSINEKRQEKREKEAAEKHQRELEAEAAEFAASNAGKNQSYRQQSNVTNNLYDAVQSQEWEVSQLTSQQQSAQEAVSQNCSGSNDNSALCQAARGSLNAVEAALNSKKTQLEQTRQDYDAAKEELDKKYNEALESNINEAQKTYDETSAAADDLCASNPSSAECAEARKKTIEAANQLMKYTSEKEKGTDDSRYETKEDVVNNLVEDQKERENQKTEQLLEYEEEQQQNLLKNEGAYADQEYKTTMDEVNTLYTQMNAVERDVGTLEQELKDKNAAANSACEKDPDGSVCSTAKLAADAAQNALNTKKNELEQTKGRYDSLKAEMENSYQQSLQSNQNQAQRDFEQAQEQQKQAQEKLADINNRIENAAAEAEDAKNAYDQALAEAQAAREAYNQAVASGKSAAETDKLQQEYNDKLTVMSDKNNDYKQKSQAYNNLSQEQKKAETSYTEAASKANDAADRLASYTDEKVNQTGETRLDSSEDVEEQILINQYKSETNPNAVAQAAKASYIENKNKTDVASYRLKEKEEIAKQAENDYQEAAQKCRESGAEADCRLAERLKNNHELAANEVSAAEQEYKSLSKELSVYEQNYWKKALDSEEYKQQSYQKEMKQAAADMNQYEIQVSKQRKVVDAAALKYTQAKNALKEGDKEGLARAADLYNEYKQAKELYDEYQNKFNLAKNNYEMAESSYQKSVSDAEILQKQLTGSLN